MNIGRIGVWTSAREFGLEHLGEAAGAVEQLGYDAFWLGGSPEAADVRPILESTDSLAAATGIVNIWHSDPGETAAACAALREDFPGRFLLGVGVGHPEATTDYRRPLTAMRGFLDGMDASSGAAPPDERVLAALAPKMLELAAARAAGSHLYFVPVEHTRFARERLGAGKVVATELACVLERDAGRAREVARGYARMYLSRRNYSDRLLEFGFSEADIVDGGSDRLIDTIIPHGSAERIAEVVHAHLDAGADHVCVQPLGEEGIPLTAWSTLAGALAL